MTDEAALLADLRGPLFEAPLLVAFVVLMSLAFVTEHVHAFMARPSDAKRRQVVTRMNPNASHVEDLRERAQATTRAISACFVASLLQVTLGLSSTTFAQAACLVVCLLAITYGGHVILAAIRTYLDWLHQHDLNLRLEASEERADA